jgi:hypothetical protein
MAMTEAQLRFARWQAGGTEAYERKQRRGTLPAAPAPKPAVRVITPAEFDIRDPSHRAAYDLDFERRNAERGSASPLGGTAVPAADRTMPFGARAAPLRQVLRDEIAVAAAKVRR